MTFNRSLALFSLLAFLLLDRINGSECNVDADCPEIFYLNPKETDSDTFLAQHKPCGWYKKNCACKFDKWFGEGNFNEDDKERHILRNVDYPGRGEHDLKRDDGIYLVEFDIGMDKTTYNAYREMEYDQDADKKILDDVPPPDDIHRVSRYLSFPANSQNKFWEDRELAVGETCIETFAESYADWGKLESGGNYNDMGACGNGDQNIGGSRDCMKHDVCSYFKTLALGEQADGFCQDFDCGDEAAQTVHNCYLRRRVLLPAKGVICDEALEETNSKFFVSISHGARLQRQKVQCTFRTGWEKNQGIPSGATEEEDRDL